MNPNRPIAFRRPDDGKLFTLNEDGFTYGLELMKTEFPNSHRFKYEESGMRRCGFTPVYEENQPRATVPYRVVARPIEKPFERDK